MNILGAGITGLLLGYETKSPVYGEVVGGQLAGMVKGPRILHETDDTRHLMRELGISMEASEFRVGYDLTTEPNRHHFKGAISSIQRAEYYAKSRGTINSPTDSAMSGGHNVIRGWDMNDIELDSLLAERTNIIESRVDVIDFSTNTVELLTKSNERVVLPLDECVSTIRLPSTLRLINQQASDLHVWMRDHKSSTDYKFPVMANEVNLDSYDTVFLQCSSEFPLNIIPEAYDYIYYPAKEVPMNRVTRVGRDFVFEVRSDKYEAAVDFIEKLGMEIGLTETIRFCQIRNPMDIRALSWRGNDVSKLRLCGRFARWNHGFKVDSIFQEARDYAGQMG